MSEIKIEMRQLNMGTPFLDEQFIPGYMYWRLPCRGQRSVTEIYDFSLYVSLVSESSNIHAPVAVTP